MSAFLGPQNKASSCQRCLPRAQHHPQPSALSPQRPTAPILAHFLRSFILLLHINWTFCRNAAHILPVARPEEQQEQDGRQLGTAARLNRWQTTRRRQGRCNKVRACQAVCRRHKRNAVRRNEKKRRHTSNAPIFRPYFPPTFPPTCHCQGLRLRLRLRPRQLKNTTQKYTHTHCRGNQ